MTLGAEPGTQQEILGGPADISRKQLWRGCTSHSPSQGRVPCFLFNGSPEKQRALPPSLAAELDTNPGPDALKAEVSPAPSVKSCTQLDSGVSCDLLRACLQQMSTIMRVIMRKLFHSDSTLRRLERTTVPVWASEQPLLRVTPRFLSGGRVAQLSGF